MLSHPKETILLSYSECSQVNPLHSARRFLPLFHESPSTKPLSILILGAQAACLRLIRIGLVLFVFGLVLFVLHLAPFDMNPRASQWLGGHGMRQSHSNPIIARNIDQARRIAALQYLHSQLHSNTNTPMPDAGTTYGRSSVNSTRNAPFQNYPTLPQPPTVNTFDRMFESIQNQDHELVTVGLDYLVSSLSTRDSEPIVCNIDSGLQAYLIRQQLIAGVSPNDVVPIDTFSAPNSLNRRSSVPASVIIQPSDPDGVVIIPRIPTPEFDGFLERLEWYPAMVHDPQNTNIDNASLELGKSRLSQEDEAKEDGKMLLREVFPDYFVDHDSEQMDATPGCSS